MRRFQDIPGEASRPSTSENSTGSESAGDLDGFENVFNKPGEADGNSQRSQTRGLNLDGLSCPECSGVLELGTTSDVLVCTACAAVFYGSALQPTPDGQATWQDRATHLDPVERDEVAANDPDAGPIGAGLGSDASTSIDEGEPNEFTTGLSPEADADSANRLDPAVVPPPIEPFHEIDDTTDAEEVDTEVAESQLELDDLDTVEPEPNPLPPLPQKSSGESAFHGMLGIDFESTIDPEWRSCPMCGTRIRSFAEVCESCGEDFSDNDSRINLKSGPSGSRHMLYAGFWERFLAISLDFAIIATPLAALIVAVINTMHVEFPGMFSRTTIFIPFGPYRVILLVVAWPYFALMESSERRATLGKRMLGLVVVDRYGERVSFIRASVRYFCRIPAEVLCLIGYVLSVFTDKRQGLHDLVSGCLIVRKQ